MSCPRLPVHILSHLSFVDAASGWIGSAWFDAVDPRANTNMAESLSALISRAYQSMSTYISLIILSPLRPNLSFLQFCSLSSSHWPHTRFPSRYICSLRVKGHWGNQTSTCTHTHKRSSSRLSDSLITQCKRAKPLRSSAVNRIRRPLVLLPSTLPLYAYFSCKCCGMCVCLCVCVV